MGNIIGAIINVAESYFNVAYNPDDSLIYKSTHGLFTDLIDPFSGKKSIVCSQFTQACLSGIAYKNSRYVKGLNSENESYFWGWKHKYLSANGQYNYFKLKGVMNDYANTDNNILPGDLVFFDTKDNGITSIDHVGICVRVEDNTLTIIHSTDNKKRLVDNTLVGVVCEQINISRFPVVGYVHAADIIKTPVECNNNKIYSPNFRKSIKFSSSTVYVASAVFENPIERGFYTVNMNIDGCDGYIKVFYKNGTQVNYQTKTKAGTTSIVFYAEMPVSKIDFRLSNGKLNSSYIVGNLEIYKGYAQPNCD